MCSHIQKNDYYTFVMFVFIRFLSLILLLCTSSIFQIYL